jgi:hypothetical protein
MPIESKLSAPSFVLTKALSRVIKVFQNLMWSEQARNRFAQIRILTRASTI